MTEQGCILTNASKCLPYSSNNLTKDNHFIFQKLRIIVCLGICFPGSKFHKNKWKIVLCYFCGQRLGAAQVKKSSAPDEQVNRVGFSATVHWKQGVRKKKKNVAIADTIHRNQFTVDTCAFHSHDSKTLLLQNSKCSSCNPRLSYTDSERKSWACRNAI